jgi:hypothetical protein
LLLFGLLLCSCSVLCPMAAAGKKIDDDWWKVEEKEKIKRT